jgi:hypothetical protein
VWFLVGIRRIDGSYSDQVAGSFATCREYVTHAPASGSPRCCRSTSYVSGAWQSIGRHPNVALRDARSPAEADEAHVVALTAVAHERFDVAEDGGAQVGYRGGGPAQA